MRAPGEKKIAKKGNEPNDSEPKKHFVCCRKPECSDLAFTDSKLLASHYKTEHKEEVPDALQTFKRPPVMFLFITESTDKQNLQASFQKDVDTQ